MAYEATLLEDLTHGAGESCKSIRTAGPTGAIDGVTRGVVFTVTGLRAVLSVQTLWTGYKGLQYHKLRLIG